jgi:hypothetical protein
MVAGALVNRQILPVPRGDLAIASEQRDRAINSDLIRLVREAQTFGTAELGRCQTHALRGAGLYTHSAMCALHVGRGAQMAVSVCLLRFLVLDLLGRVVSVNFSSRYFLRRLLPRGSQKTREVI